MLNSLSNSLVASPAIMPLMFSRQASNRVTAICILAKQPHMVPVSARVQLSWPCSGGRNEPVAHVHGPKNGV